MSESDDDLFAEDPNATTAAANAFGLLLHETEAEQQLPDSDEGWRDRLLAASEDLTLDACSMGDSGATQLASALAAGHGRALVSLALDSNDIGDTGARALAVAFGSVGALPRLERLFLSHNSISGACIGELVGAVAPSGGVAQLCSLDLNGNPLGDQGLAALGAAVASGCLQQLVKLFLDRAQIGDDGLTSFSASMRSAPSLLPKLYELWLSNNRLRARGATELFAAFADGALATLGDLRLQFNGIGNAGIDALVAALERGALRNAWYLGLSDDAVLTDDGLRTLEASVASGALPRLEFLTASGPHTSDAARRSVQDAFTNRPRPART